MNRRLSLYLMAAGAVTLWGASFPLTKLALQWLGPTAIACLRWAISAGFLAGWLLRGRRMPLAGQILRRHLWTAAWVALTGITLYYVVQNLALGYTTAINAGVLTNLVPVFIVLIGTTWLGERLAAAEWAAAAAAFAGAILVSQGAGHLAIAGPGLLGDALMVLASLLAAIYSIGGKGLVARYPADATMTVFAMLGALFLLPLALWEGSSRGGFAATLAALPWQAWGVLLLLGLGSGALGNLWWLEILRRTDASRAALILFLVPVIAAALAVILLGEPLTPAVAVGGLLVLAGVAVVQRRSQGGRRITETQG